MNMKSMITIFIITTFACTGLLFSVEKNKKIDLPDFINSPNAYLGQTPPDNTPKIFELPVTTGLHPVERITISADGKEIYYGELDTWPATAQRIKCFKYSDNKWQGPFVVFEGYIAPAFSVNGDVMYMQKNIKIGNIPSAPTIYVSKRTDKGWSTPTQFFSKDLPSHYLQDTKLKSIYLSSALLESPENFDLFKLTSNNPDPVIQNLGEPINTPGFENDFYIARDESYMIFIRFQRGSASDMYITFKNDKGVWGNPKKLPDSINTPNPNWECCPYVTDDNKYLFFTRGGNDMASYHTYWVKIDNIIDSLKKSDL